MTPTEATLRAQLAAHVRWSREEDRASATAAARASFLDRFEREVDPDGTLDPRERAIRAQHAKAAHMRRLALKRHRRV